MTDLVGAHLSRRVARLHLGLSALLTSSAVNHKLASRESQIQPVLASCPY